MGSENFNRIAESTENAWVHRQVLNLIDSGVSAETSSLKSLVSNGTRVDQSYTLEVGDHFYLCYRTDSYIYTLVLKVLDDMALAVWMDWSDKRRKYVPRLILLPVSCCYAGYKSISFKNLPMKWFEGG